MATKPRVTCRHPGCPELIPAGQKYCEKHKALHPEEVRSAARRGYGKRWQAASKAYLRGTSIMSDLLSEGTLREGRGCGSHRPTPRRPGALLGPEQLAASLQEMSRSENTK